MCHSWTMIPGSKMLLLIQLLLSSQAISMAASGEPPDSGQVDIESDQVLLNPEIELDILTQLQKECPLIYPKVFVGQVPAGKLGDNQTMTYKRFTATSFEDCYKGCCGDDKCNAVFAMVNGTKISCFKTTCVQDELCLPTPPAEDQVAKIQNKSFLVLVRPSQHQSWYEFFIKSRKGLEVTSALDRDPSALGTSCEVGLDLEACMPNEVCEPLNDKSRNGVCKCKEGMARNDEGQCIDLDKTDPVPNSTPTTTTTTTTSTISSTEKAVAVAKITVQVVSKEIQLPTNSAELAAYGIPEAPPTNPYSYQWKLMDVIKNEADKDAQKVTKVENGNMKGANTQILQLSDLEQGIYQFKVVVQGVSPPVYGEALANVTVLPPKHINKPPVAVVQPPYQVFSLPTSKAIIDASGSTDDAPKEELTFKWELVTEPLGYQPSLTDGPLLTLDNLVAGNYTVKVIVTDKDGASDQALARLNILPETDYPPVANAGEDKVIHLPQNQVTLNGNKSHDDHEIVAWEWTRKSSQPGQVEAPADTNNMRTPYPTISNLEEGTYTFVLKVKDSKGQTAEDEVNIYVKPAVNLPPKADAGKDVEISLPQTWVTLDGSESSDDIAITSSEWSVVSGPKKELSFSDNLSLVTNVTGLTKGVYVFRLTVMDNLDNKESDTVKVTVTQDKNADPVAKAGSEFTVEMPINFVALDGSKSSDDLGIVRWQWSRQDGSLAAGRVINDSDKTPVMTLVDLVPGQYAFQLQVWDEQGRTATDSVGFEVKEDPNKLKIVQAVFNVPLTELKKDKLSTIIQGLQLLLSNRNKYKIKPTDLFPETDSGNAVMHFIVVTSEEDAKMEEVASGVKVVHELQEKLEAGSELLPVKILSLDTWICQNDCSGHGRCDQATRTCICDSFWVENVVRFHLMDGKSNCEWSIIYVGIFLGIAVSLLVCGACYSTCKKSRSRGSSKLKAGRKAKYARLDQSDNMELRSRLPWVLALLILVSVLRIVYTTYPVPVSKALAFVDPPA